MSMFGKKYDFVRNGVGSTYQEALNDVTKRLPHGLNEGDYKGFKEVGPIDVSDGVVKVEVHYSLKERAPGFATPAAPPKPRKSTPASAPPGNICELVNE